jgi:DEAD/DEAH box helicase domain-containing protein
VEQLDWDGRKAYVTRTHVDYYTDSIDYTKLKVDRFDGWRGRPGDSHHGEVHVVRRVAGYKKIRYYTHENIGYGPVTLPDQELHTTAVWWQLPQAVLLRAFADRQDALDGFLGAAYALHIVATVAVMADARDLQKPWATVTARGSPPPTKAAAASCAAQKAKPASSCCRASCPPCTCTTTSPAAWA